MIIASHIPELALCLKGGIIRLVNMLLALEKKKKEEDIWHLEKQLNRNTFALVLPCASGFLANFARGQIHFNGLTSVAS